MGHQGYVGQSAAKFDLNVLGEVYMCCRQIAANQYHA